MMEVNALDIERKEIIVSSLKEQIGDLRGLRAVDLGCWNGHLSFALAGEGVNVLGIDAREENLEEARRQLEERKSNLRGHVEFVREDVKQFSVRSYGCFDIVLACGIFYHLDDPVLWVWKIFNAAWRILVLDTHVAPLRDEHPAVRKYGLGPLESVEVEGQKYMGRWFPENPDGSNQSAFSNGRSFWLTKVSLLHVLRSARNSRIYETENPYSEDYSRLILMANLLKREGK